MLRILSKPLFLTALLGGALLAGPGCDPKLTGVDGGAGTGGGTGDDPPELSVSEEAAVVGAVVALQVDVIRSVFGVASDFGGAPPAPHARTMFTSDCVTTTQTATNPLEYEIVLANCVDERGTSHRGGGLIREDSAVEDGFIFFPYLDAAELIRAENLTNERLNHTLEQGAFFFEYLRSTDDAITGMKVSNYLRHSLLTEIASFTWFDAEFPGTLGNLAQYPASGGRIQVGWNGVAPFDVIFSGGATATFRVLGINYVVNMGSGAVSLGDNT